MQIQISNKCDHDIDIVITLPDAQIAKVFDGGLDVVIEARAMFKSMARAMRAADKHLAHRLTTEEVHAARHIVHVYNKAYKGRFGSCSPKDMSYADQALLGLYEQHMSDSKVTNPEDMNSASDCCGCYTTMAREYYPYSDEKPLGPAYDTLFLVRVCLHCKRRIEWLKYDDTINDAVKDHPGERIEKYNRYPTYDEVLLDSYKTVEEQTI